MGDNKKKYVLAGLAAIAVGLFAYKACESVRGPVRKCVSDCFSDKSSSRSLDGGAVKTDEVIVKTTKPEVKEEEKEGKKRSDLNRKRSSGRIELAISGEPFIKIGELDDREFDLFTFQPENGEGIERAYGRFDRWDGSRGNQYQDTGTLNVVDVNGNPVRILYLGKPGYIKARPIGVRLNSVGEGASGRIESGKGDKSAAGDAEGSDGRERAGDSDKKGGDAEEGEGKGNEKETGPEGFEVKFTYRLPVREGDPLTDHYRNDITSFLQECLDRGDRGEFMLRYAIDVRGNLLRAIPERVSGKGYPANCARELSELVVGQRVPSADGIFGSAKLILEGR